MEAQCIEQERTEKKPKEIKGYESFVKGKGVDRLALDLSGWVYQELHAKSTNISII